MDAKKELLISAMNAAGYTYNDLESTDTFIRFTGDLCQNMAFDSWIDVEEWLNGVVFDDPDVSERVENILLS